MGAYKATTKQWERIKQLQKMGAYKATTKQWERIKQLKKWEHIKQLQNNRNVDSN
jgi:hypothetical protein